MLKDAAFLHVSYHKLRDDVGTSVVRVVSVTVEAIVASVKDALARGQVIDAVLFSQLLIQ